MAVVPQLCLCVYITLAHHCMSVLGKSNQMDLLASVAVLILKTYRSMKVLRNGNRFILVPIVGPTKGNR